MLSDTMAGDEATREDQPFALREKKSQFQQSGWNGADTDEGEDARLKLV